MEKDDADEPENKDPHFSSLSSSMAVHSVSSPHSGDVGVSVLQHQNQNLVQKLEVQKHKLQDLEYKIRELKVRQCVYDDVLISVNQQWNQLVNHLVLLTLRARRRKDALQILDRLDRSRVFIPSCPEEDIFLCRILERESVHGFTVDVIAKLVEEILSLRQSSTLELMIMLENAFGAMKSCINNIPQVLDQSLSEEDASTYVSKVDDLMRMELHNLDDVVQNLRLKHEDYTNEIQSYKEGILIDQSEIKLLTGELEERMAELEECRIKLVNLKMREYSNSGVGQLAICAGNQNLSSERLGDKAMGLQDLKGSIEEAKVLADSRLSELQVLRDEIFSLLELLQDLQDEVTNDKYIYSSRPYCLLNDQLQHWNAELERYMVLTDALQADRYPEIQKESEFRSAGSKKESELTKREAVDSAINTSEAYESRLEELERQIQACMTEKHEVELKIEESIQGSAKKDVKGEFDVMASALTKEIAMMEARLNHWKETALEVVSLREKRIAFMAVLDKKESEQKTIAHKCKEQSIQIKSYNAKKKNLQKENLKLQKFLDMHMQQLHDSRDLTEIKESERRAHLQAEVLKNALDEHSLELRITAANEAEAACQDRLTAAETEIEGLRRKLDASHRDILEHDEAVKVKDAEIESYIAEIETIGQAYEDMQTQNHHLLQQMTERDDYSIKLASESVKSKQMQNVLLLQNQELSKKLQKENDTIESLKIRIGSSEEQMKNYAFHAVKAIEEGRHDAVILETVKWELDDAEKELKCLKFALGSADKDHENMQHKMKDMQVMLERERGERQQLEEELVGVNEKMEEMSSEIGEGAIQKLQKEIKDCKTILKCSVCFDRPKEVVIIKCCHIFCNQCIQRNLEMRHRRCPGCATPFGQNDVRFVKI